MLPAIIEVLRELRETLASTAFRKVMRNRFALVAFFFASMWVLSALLFYYAEHVHGGRDIDLSTCLYWSLITMATVGYGDVVPETGLGRLVAGITAVLGIVAYTLTVSVIADAFLEKGLRRAMGLAPLKRKEIIVIGSDETCWDLVDELVANGLADRVGWFTDKQPATEPPVDFFVGDPMRAEDMRKAGVDKARHIVLCLGDDSKALHVALLAKKLNHGAKIHAIVRSSELADLLREAGVETVLSIRLLGRALASAIFEPSVVKFIDEAVSVKGIADVTETEAKNLAGLTVAEAQDKLSKQDKTYRYQVIGIIRGGKLILAPSLREKIAPSDKLLVLRVKKQPGTIELSS